MRKVEEFYTQIEIMTDELRNNKKKRETLKNHIGSTYGILPDDVIKMLDEPSLYIEEFPTVQKVIFAKQLIHLTGNSDMNLEDYFTIIEIDEARYYKVDNQYYDLKLPFTFDNVIIVNPTDNIYMTTVSLKDIKRFYDSQTLYYNFEYQRELDTVIRKNGEVRKIPKLYPNNVEEIKDDLLKRKLKPTQLIWNAEPNSGIGGKGELIYKPDTLQLIVTKGSKLGILDGYHRLNGVMKALMIDPELDFKFPLLITNYDIEDAADFQGQIAKATPIGKNRKIQLNTRNLSGKVVDRLERDSDLRDRITLSDKVFNSRTDSDLIEYGELKRLIDKHFTIKTKTNVNDVSDYLIEFFDTLINIYVDDFITNMPQSREHTLVVNRNMFAGYIKLAFNMYENSIAVANLEFLLRDIDFDRDNAVWKEIGFLNELGRLNPPSKQLEENIENYFDEIELGVVM